MAFSTLKGIIDADYSGVSDATEGASGDFDSLADSAQNTGRSMQRAGGMMTAGISAPLTAMGAMSARVAASFDQNMQQSIAVMGDVDEAMREDLEETAREVARTTTMSADQAAESYYFLASAGFSAAESMEAMPQVAAFAEAGQMDMAEATDVATNVMSAYGLEAENLSDVTDVMTATVTSHNQTMEGMSAAFRNAAPAAASMGIEIEELAALTGALGDVGIQAEEAGTALNSMMRRMSKRSGEAGQALDDLGVQTTDANGELLPMIDIIEQLEDANMSSAQASQIFGRQMSAGSALVDQGADSLRSYQSDLEDSEGATEDVADTQKETLNAEMEIAKSNVQDVGIAIGSQLLPMLSTLTGYVSTAAEYFQDLSEGQQKAIILFGGLAAAIGPVLMVGGTMLAMLPAMASGWTIVAGAASSASLAMQGVRAAIYGIYTALGPIGAVLIGLGIAASALYAAWQTDFMGIRDTTSGVVNTILGYLEGLIEYVNSIPGVDIDWDAPEVDFSKEEEEAEEGGEDVEAAFEDGLGDDFDMNELMDGEEFDFSEEAFEGGQDASQAFGQGLEDQDPIEGWSPEIREALEGGVEGYVSDPDEIEADDTEISEELFNAVASQEDGASAETLGVTDEEFSQLRQRYGAGGAAGSGADPVAQDMAGMQTGGGGGSEQNDLLETLIAEVKQLRASLEGTQGIEGELSFPGSGLDAHIDGRINRQSEMASNRGNRQV